ncbi:plasmid partitioning protein RepB C-terminal domain-containing protein [Paraburkholderia sp. FT54]|uniref:plasmid partitioning protein RepB C-terminal domain-containing protein n=1 Tax=Paraburkholderia sp. FT54 TaxID=3074437 RepID=UPI00287761BE|nr:plasmid partitioning protein RepB C-terminal domain-containing protein [Paraburkholderia sp. FT54]WNC95044.1 plasmid partitioning protein RepB C-terminal domain-containing protein [Paraburkholderia sp. FT54]
MVANAATPIADISVNRIRVLNPRTRSKRQRQALMGNIAAVGLKKPITVSRRTSEDGTTLFDLVCGQGRLEAVQALGHDTIPANVVDRAQDECLLMSLVENIARRNHSTLELLREIQRLRKDGYDESVVADKVGLSVAYLADLMFLLDRGEERLIAAVEAGTVPIAVAVQISRANDVDVRSALMDAYEDGTLSGRQLAVVRRLLNRRLKSGGKALSVYKGPSGTRPRELAPDQLRRLYMRESERQRVLVKRVELVHARLLFITHALRELMRESEFVHLLEQEGLTTLPRVLDQRIRGESKS